MAAAPRGLRIRRSLCVLAHPLCSEAQGPPESQRPGVRGPPPPSASFPLSRTDGFPYSPSTGATRLVSFELEAPEGAALDALPGGAPQGGPPYLCCWKDEDATEPKFYIPLKGCRMVNNITELGPCLYFVSSTGEFEFQCSSRQACARWVETFKGLGVCLLKFTDLYKLTDFIGLVVKWKSRMVCFACGRLNAGEGSFAKVYMGKHLFTGEEVVIKAVDKKKVLESNVYTEIEVLRKVSHPYIMRLYAAYEQEDFVCLVLEYLRGGELFDYLSEKGPFSEDQARHAMRRILLALQAMHMKGIVHRDLKTENLIIEHPSNPASIKIIDFGLAATVGSQEMKMRCGSPGYVAPEILQDLPYGPKVDVFSSGVILYTLLAGFPPFRGQNVKDILKKNLSHQRWAGVPHSVKDLIGWMCCKQPAKRCAAVQALTHPWFQRIARPLPKAAALSTLAAEESDRKATLQHLEQTQQGQREPLGLRAGGEAPGEDVTGQLNERMQGLRLRSKAAEAAKQSRGPSFFNSAPPGAAAASDAPSERETHYKLQTTESQGGLREPTSTQTVRGTPGGPLVASSVTSPHAPCSRCPAKEPAVRCMLLLVRVFLRLQQAQAIQAAVKAAVKAVESREAAAQKAAAKAQASAEAKAAAAEVVRALTAARQPLWAAQDQEEEDRAGPRNCPSAAPETLDYASAGGDAAAAVAAAAAAAAADIFGAAAELARMQQQQQQQQEDGPCSRAARIPLAHHSLGSPVALMASEAPIPAEVSERLSSSDSESPPPTPMEDNTGTPKWGQGSATPTDPSSTSEKPEEEPSSPAAATAPTAGPPALVTRNSRRHQWLEEPPPSPDSGGSTQASPTAAFRNCQMAELSLALDLECPEHSGASSGDPLADPFEEPFKNNCKVPSNEASRKALKLPQEDASSTKAIARSCKITASGEAREVTQQQGTRPASPEVDPLGASESPQAAGPSSSCSPCALSDGRHDQWGTSSAMQGDEALRDGLTQGLQDTHQQKQQVTLTELCARTPQGDWKRLKRRATLRPPRLSVEHQEAPCGDRPAVFDSSSDSQESPVRQRNKAAAAAATQVDAPSQGATVGGCTQAAVIRAPPPSWPLREDARGRGRSAVRLENQTQGFPSLVLPTMGKRHEAPDGPGEVGGPLQSPPALRTVKMQPYKQLHSHHYLVKGANEVIRSGSLPSGKNLVRAPCTSTATFEMPQLGIPSQRFSEERSTRHEAPPGSVGAAGGWRASGVSCSSYEGTKAFYSKTRKGIGKPMGTSATLGTPIPEGSPSAFSRKAPLLEECHVAPHELPPSHSSSTSSTSSNRSSSHCNGPRRRGEGSCNQGSRQHQQPLHALQSRLFDFMGLPVLSKMASALGARDWLRHRSRNAGPIPGSPPGEPAERRPISKASQVGEEGREGRLARALDRDSGKTDVFEEG
ncbi:hypothetical protein Emag_000401 [Eimeria magna]